MKKIREQKGSITLLVLVACMFMIAVLLIVNIGIMNKNTSQEKELVQISKNYAVNEKNLADSYAKIANENGYPTYEEVQRMIEKAKCVCISSEEMEQKIEKAVNKAKEELNQTIEEAKIEAKLESFPVGSIYMSTNPANPSSYIGGTWESYGQGRTLIGAGTGTDTNNSSQLFKVGATGGEYTYKLSTNQLPSHNHTMTPSGSIISDFIGTPVNTAMAGIHSHSMSVYWTVAEMTSNGGNNLWIRGGKPNPTTYGTANSAQAGEHTHSVTAEGTVSSTFTGNSGITSSEGNGTAISQLQPYIVTYMWKRIE